MKIDLFQKQKTSKDNLIKAIQVKTGKYQKHDENSNFIQPDIRIKSINDLIEKIQFNKINAKVTLGGCFIEKINKTILISREKSFKN